VTEISGFSAAGSPNCLRCYAFNLGNKETAGARWMNVTRSFVRPAPRFAASSSSPEKERREEMRKGKSVKENLRRKGTTSRDALSGTYTIPTKLVSELCDCADPMVEKSTCVYEHYFR